MLSHLVIINPIQIVIFHQFCIRLFQIWQHLTMVSCMPNLFANPTCMRLSGTFLSVPPNIRLCILMKLHLAASVTIILFNSTHLVQSKNLCNSTCFICTLWILVNLFLFIFDCQRAWCLLAIDEIGRPSFTDTWSCAFSAFPSPILMKATLFNTSYWSEWSWLVP